MKHVLLGLVLLIFCGILFVGGVHLFGRHIYNTKSCQFYNIDNIELRTGVDIPKVISTDCKCDGTTKTSKFIIDLERLDLDRYVTRNDLILKNDIYIKENDNENSTYKVSFNKKTGELLVNLIYKDN